MRGDQEERAHGTYGSRRFVIFVKKRGSRTAWDPRCFTTTQGEAQLSVGCVARSDWLARARDRGAYARACSWENFGSQGRVHKEKVWHPEPRGSGGHDTAPV
uniref:Uncharacterized protein n=1 Tax=Oryza sativa subsp. japonica TaxID=39947 RepID=Q6K253_ORYSJ|nr:hypothetical protein [Oryza sativa Japonica Group]BAD26128.1 hypothetical protein [Oryza sativa Japonica Group]